MRQFLRNIFQKAGLLPLAQKIYLGVSRAIVKTEVAFLLPLLSSCSFCRRLFFAFFSNTFVNEMKMYVAGRSYYLTNTIRHVPNASLLRRNIHRLEKGLMAENRRPVFALDYIRETVLQFQTFVKSLSPDQLQDWAWDVLNNFFDVTGSHPKLDAAKRIFYSISYRKLRVESSFLPYQKTSLPENAAEYFAQIVKSRKSVRTFVPGSLPTREQIERAVSLASLAPSSCNRQPFAFYIFENKPVVEAIARLAGGAKAFADNIPALAVVVGSTSASPSPGDRHLLYIDGSLAAMNFMLALESMSVASCPINWPDNKKPEKELRKIVALKPYERPILIIAMGKASEKALVACSARKSLDELCRFNPEMKQ